MFVSSSSWPSRRSGVRAVGALDLGRERFIRFVRFVGPDSPLNAGRKLTFIPVNSLNLNLSDLFRSSVKMTTFLFGGCSSTWTKPDVHVKVGRLFGRSRSKWKKSPNSVTLRPQTFLKMPVIFLFTSVSSPLSSVINELNWMNQKYKPHNKLPRAEDALFNLWQRIISSRLFIWPQLFLCRPSLQPFTARAKMEAKTKERAEFD